MSVTTAGGLCAPSIYLFLTSNATPWRNIVHEYFPRLCFKERPGCVILKSIPRVCGTASARELKILYIRILFIAACVIFGLQMMIVFRFIVSSEIRGSRCKLEFFTRRLYSQSFYYLSLLAHEMLIRGLMYSRSAVVIQNGFEICV